MAELLIKLLKSRKVIMTIMGTLVVPWVAKKFNIPSDVVQSFVYGVIAYVLGQSGVDAANYFKASDSKK